MLALVIDWALSMLAVGAFLGQDIWTGEGAAAWAPLTVFGLEVWILTALARWLGRPAGHRGGHPAYVRSAVGPVARPGSDGAACLVIPPVFYNRDQQGLHDLAVDSIALRR